MSGNKQIVFNNLRGHKPYPHLWLYITGMFVNDNSPPPTPKGLRSSVREVLVCKSYLRAVITVKSVMS